MMIDENKDYVIRSKLTITVKTHNKNNDKNKVATNQTNKRTKKQTHRHRNWQNLGRKTKRHTYKYTHNQTYKCTHIKRDRNEKMKNKCTLCSVNNK